MKKTMINKVIINATADPVNASNGEFEVDFGEATDTECIETWLLLSYDLFVQLFELHIIDPSEAEVDRCMTLLTMLSFGELVTIMHGIVDNMKGSTYSLLPLVDAINAHMEQEADTAQMLMSIMDQGGSSNTIKS